MNRRRRPYLVWSFDYRPDSAGQKTMHRLCHELNLAGCRAFVGFRGRNRAWRTPFREAPLPGDWIAVYPEIVAGNPWRAPRVARYVLNVPGKLGGDPTYDPAEDVFVFSELFNTPGVPPDRILYLPTIELDLYVDRRLPRSGVAYYVGKGRRSRTIDGVEITDELKRDRELLVATLNRVEVLYCFDLVSAMARIALLCGCRVVLVPGDDYDRATFDRLVATPGVGWDEVPGPFDSDGVRAEEVAAYAAFRRSLETFVAVTQA